MKIREVSVSRVKNLGNYENEKVGMVAVLDEGEDPVQATRALEDRVRAALGQPSRAVEEAQVVADKADALWRTARSDARSWLNAERDAMKSDNESYKERRTKDAAEFKAEHETALVKAQAEEQRPEVVAARKLLGQEPGRCDLQKIRAEVYGDDDAEGDLFGDADDDAGDDE